MSRRLEILCLLAVAAAIFGTNIGGYDLWPPDEPRFGQVAREMMRSGNYLAPHVNGEPYREKPPLLFWAIALVSKPWGDVTAASARIPSVAAALVTLLCTYLLSERLFDRRRAFWSVVVLATCLRFWWQARTVQIDMLLTACLTAALLFFWLWHEQRRVGLLVAFYLCVAGAVYAKGPPGLVFPLLFILAFFWKRKEARRNSHWIVGTLAVAGAIALWLVPARMSVAGHGSGTAEGAMAENLFRQTIGRFVLGVSHAQPPWYYVVNLAADLMPWTLFLPFVLPYLWKQRRSGVEIRFLLAWIVPALIFFTISTGKRAVYLLPLFPAMAILIAWGVVELMDGPRETWRRRTALLWGLLLSVLAAAPFAVLFTEYREAWSGWVLLFSGVGFALAGHALYTAAAPGGETLHGRMAAHMAVLEILAAIIVFPLVDAHKSARDFCAPLRALRDSGEEYRLYSIGFSREEYVFYSDHFHEPLLTGGLDVAWPDGFEEEDGDAVARSIRKDIEEATENVPIGSFEGLTEAERASLSEAARLVLEECADRGVPAEAFVEAVLRETAVLKTPAATGQPAFAFIKEDDLRWLLALVPGLRDYPAVKAASVGSRDVLLLANAPGRRLLGPGP